MEFEVMPLRKVFGCKRMDVIRRCRKLDIKEFHNFCCSRNINRRIKSKRVVRVENIARVENRYKILFDEPEYLFIGGRIILKWMLKEWV
jgi:hypothetical protein